VTMNFHTVRLELRRLGGKKLFKIVMNQKESKCLTHGFCSLLFKYEGYTFCLSEVLGRGCEIEGLKKLEKEMYTDEAGPLREEEAEASLFDCRERSLYNLIKREDGGRQEMG